MLRSGSAKQDGPRCSRHSRHSAVPLFRRPIIRIIQSQQPTAARAEQRRQQSEVNGQGILHENQRKRRTKGGK